MSKDSLKPTVKVVANDLLLDIVVQAHMDGQLHAGKLPSHKDALDYYNSMFSTPTERTNEEKGK